MQILYDIIQYIVNPLIYLLIGLAVIYFLWGVFKFVQNADKPEERITGARHILAGVVGIAVMFSVFALIHIIQNTIGPNSYHPDTIGF